MTVSTINGKAVSTIQEVVTRNIYICYYNYNADSSKCEWLLIDNESEAKETDASYELASYEDLLHWTAATNQTFEGIINVIESNCKWFEESYVDFVGNTDMRCGYEIIWD